MLSVRAALWRQYCGLCDLVEEMVSRNSEPCRRFIAILGVGPVNGALFHDGDRRSDALPRSRDVAVYFGRTPRRWQSSTSIDVQGRISKAADADVRRALYEAASGLIARFKGRNKDKVKSTRRSLNATATARLVSRWRAS